MDLQNKNNNRSLYISGAPYFVDNFFFQRFRCSTKQNKKKRKGKNISYGFVVTGVISIGSLFLCRRESSVISDSRNNSFHGRFDCSYFSSSSFSNFSNASSGNKPIQSISSF
jgi:hypothetical protein